MDTDDAELEMLAVSVICCFAGSLHYTCIQENTDSLYARRNTRD